MFPTPSRFISYGVAGAFLCLTICASAVADTTTSFNFVSSLVSDIAHFQHIRDKAANDATSAGSDYVGFATSCIRNSTSLSLELRSQATKYQDTNLGGQFSALGPSIADIWGQEAQLNDQFVANCKKLLSSSDALSQMQIFRGEIAELSARWDYLDETIFKAVMPMAIYSLLSTKPDSTGHMTNLNVSRSGRKTLINSIGENFGQDLVDAKPGFLIQSVLELRQFLQNDNFYSSDNAH